LTPSEYNLTEIAMEKTYFDRFLMENFHQNRLVQVGEEEVFEIVMAVFLWIRSKFLTKFHQNKILTNFLTGLPVKKKTADSFMKGL